MEADAPVAPHPPGPTPDVGAPARPAPPAAAAAAAPSFSAVVGSDEPVAAESPAEAVPGPDAVPTVEPAVAEEAPAVEPVEDVAALAEPEPEPEPEPGPLDAEALTVLERELADVGRALERLDAGTYGTCEVCGDPIGDERLARLPATATCGAHAPAR